MSRLEDALKKLREKKSLPLEENPDDIKKPYDAFTEGKKMPKLNDPAGDAPGWLKDPSNHEHKSLAEKILEQIHELEEILFNDNDRIAASERYYGKSEKELRDVYEKLVTQHKKITNDPFDDL
jgi:hypothetical protein